MLARMGRPPREAASPSAFASALLRLVAAAGGDAALLAAQSGLEETAAASDEVGITPSALAGMLRGAAAVLADPHLALRLPAALPLRRYDAVALAARAAASPRDVLTLVAQYAALVFPQLEARVEGDATELRFSTRLGGHPRGLGYLVDEYVLGPSSKVEG